jgi:hypothetical protein
VLLRALFANLAHDTRSLATLLTLSVPQQALSPAMSQSSLTSLVAPSFYPPAGSASPRRIPSAVNAFDRPTRPSPFAFAPLESFEDEEEMETRDGQDSEDRRQWEEDQSLSEDDFYAEDEAISDDEGTQLGPRTQYQRIRAIPIPSTSKSTRARARSQSDSLPNPSTSFSPIQSRPFALGPSSASPPAWSRRRPRRGQRRSSMSPVPASLEERSRARARGTTDVKDEGVEPGSSSVALPFLFLLEN